VCRLGIETPNAAISTDSASGITARRWNFARYQRNVPLHMTPDEARQLVIDVKAEAEEPLFKARDDV
jgi:hypothetical protein